MTGLGLLNWINAGGVTRFDVIPVDIVCNSIIVATANGAKIDPIMEVYNSGTSVQNFITIKDYVKYLLDALSYHEFNKRALPVNLKLIKNKLEF